MYAGPVLGHVIPTVCGTTARDVWLHLSQLFETNRELCLYSELIIINIIVLVFMAVFLWPENLFYYISVSLYFCICISLSLSLSLSLSSLSLRSQRQNIHTGTVQCTYIDTVVIIVLSVWFFIATIKRSNWPILTSTPLRLLFTCSARGSFWAVQLHCSGGQCEPSTCDGGQQWISPGWRGRSWHQKSHC